MATPELNTLYVDRTLKGAGLIQAYSNQSCSGYAWKTLGADYQLPWPARNEKLMNEALSFTPTKISAKLSDEERKVNNTKDKITAPKYEELLDDTKQIMEKICEK